MKLLERFQRILPGLARTNPCDGQGRARVRGRAIYILPTGSGIVFGAVLLLMLLGSLNYQNNLGLLFTFLSASVVLVAMHHTWFNLLGLGVTARGGGPVFAGEDASFDVRLDNSGRGPRADLRVIKGAAHGGPRDLGPLQETAIPLRLQTARRGRLVLERIRLETRHPLGLFTAWCYIDAEARVTVYPRPAPRSPNPAPIPSYRHSASGDRGVGADDFMGLRGYRVGDSPRQLDWKAFGRERGLVVKQFGGDRADQLWLDWSLLPAVAMEDRLSLLCRQVLDAAETDLTFGLRLPGIEVPMGQGDAHKHRCLETLAELGHA
jgi:uncharacterized protein (DUF58 family)